MKSVQSNSIRQLILLRHGESIWNKENLFTGWTDVDLSDQGKAEGIEAGRILKEHGHQNGINLILLTHNKLILREFFSIFSHSKAAVKLSVIPAGVSQ
jgi:bisphosphoglycerate-dependent phosphoglycerate mutase